MAKKKYYNISEIPSDELKSMMVAFGKEKAKSVKSARAFLRSIGFEVTPKGEISPSVDYPIATSR